MNDARDLRSADDPGRSGVQVTSPQADADLCRRLRARGSARGGDGLRDLWMALDGGVGVLFGQRRAGGGYDWLRDSPLDAEYLPMVEDISSKVVRLERASGDAAAAQRAAQVAGMVARHRASVSKEMIGMGNIGRRRRRIEVLPAEPATPEVPAPQEEPAKSPERLPQPAR